MGAVLIQVGRPLTYLSNALKGNELLLFTYENERHAIVATVRKCQSYLLDHSFVVKMDQQTLKFLLAQRIGTLVQKKWINKLFGYDFVIRYKKEKENKVVDTLSHKEEHKEDFVGSLAMISFPNPIWIEN